MKKLQFLSILLLVAFAVLPLVGKGSFNIIEVDADKLDVPEIGEGDLSDVLDSLLDNITAEIAPASSVAGSGAELASPQIVHVGKVLVRASTFDYQVREWIDELDSAKYPLLHNANPEFLQAYFQAASLTGTYSLKSMFSMYSGVAAGFDSIESIEAIEAINTLMGTNDSAEATGYNDDFTEKYSIDDLAAETETVMNATELIDYSAVEEQYQQFANFTESNETSSGLLGDDKVTDDLRLKTIVSGFDNVQEAVYEILCASIAANYSSPGDQIDPERVSIIDSDLDNANKTTYMTQNFVDRARAIINNEFIEAQSTVSLFGLKLKPVTIIVPASGFFSTKSLSAGLGKIVKLGKTVVSAPLRVAKTTAGKIKQTLIDKPISAIKGTITRGVEMGKSIVHKALATPSNIIKTIGGQAKSFVQTATKAVTPLVSSAGKLVTKGLSVVGGFVKSFMNILPFLLILAAVAGVILLVVYFLFLRPSTPTPR